MCLVHIVSRQRHEGAQIRQILPDRKSLSQSASYLRREGLMVEKLENGRGDGSGERLQRGLKKLSARQSPVFPEDYKSANMLIFDE